MQQFLEHRRSKSVCALILWNLQLSETISPQKRKPSQVIKNNHSFYKVSGILPLKPNKGKTRR